VICERLQMPDGGTAIVCRDGRRKRCAICGALGAEKLCDGPPPIPSSRATCDRPLCSSCATHVEGEDRDYCPEHKELAMQPRGGPPRPVGELAVTAEILAQARERVGRAIPARTDATAPPAPEVVHPLPSRVDPSAEEPHAASGLQSRQDDDAPRAEAPPSRNGGAGSEDGTAKPEGREQPAAAPPTPAEGIELFEQLAAAFHRETGVWPPGKDRAAAAGSDGIDENSSWQRWHEWLRDRRRAAAAPPRPPEPEPEPAPNSPEDIGFTNFETPQPAAPRQARLPSGTFCKSCNARIFWAQVVDRDGHLVPKDNGQKGHKAMPIDYDPPLTGGNVICARRAGDTVVARVLRRGEEPPPGANLRTSHFATCPEAAQHRRSKKGRR
jgi:hypothetical protein